MSSFPKSYILGKRGCFILKNGTLCWFSISFNVSHGSENGDLSSGFSSQHFVFIPYL